MTYRAKITRILSTVEMVYDLNKCNLVYDSKDVYLEVSTKAECSLLNHLNDLEMWRVETLCCLFGEINKISNVGNTNKVK